MRRSTLVDLTGMQFERLTVIKRAPNRGKRVYWLCQCSCENKTIKEVDGVSLKTGHTKSCGCLKREVDNAKIKKYNKDIGCEEHNMSQSRLYNIWSGMIKRCYNENSERYNDYGGRGINVCDEWHKSFIAFKDWALSNGYSDNLTLDREDNEKGYYPNNCRWTTVEKQNNNSRHNRLITMDGVTRNLAEWCRVLDLDYHIVRGRLAKGWDVERALKQPIIPRSI